MFRNKKVLITGGTGSFGFATTKRILDTDVKEIRIFSRDEKKQEDMRHYFNNKKLKFYIGDIRDFQSISDACKGVDFIFCAAALKQVPSCEFYPMQAVATNILGVENTLNAAINNKVKSVVVLSTDKAVRPINAMGMSKALMEKISIAKARSIEDEGTKICITRYGNVLASRGSVVPLFIDQIQSDKSITITDPEMTRFIMSLDEAVDLVFHAHEYGKNGDIFVRKAPAATIKQIAEVLMLVFAKDVDIKIIGPRHGEKKHESLLSKEEMIHAIEDTLYYRIPFDSRDLNYFLLEKGEKKLTELDDYTSENTHRLSDRELFNILEKLDYIQEELGKEKD